MKTNKYVHIVTLIIFTCVIQCACSQTSPVQKIFPQGSTVYNNVAYANDTLKKHLLDIYLPAGAKINCRLLYGYMEAPGC